MGVLLSPPAAAQEIEESEAIELDRAAFAEWLADFRAEAGRAGISDRTLDAVFQELEPNQRVIELDRKQPESILSLEEYLERAITKQKVETGREMLWRHRRVLNRISAEYGVPPRIIVAIWGIESQYGKLPGNFSVVSSLATLAFEGRRAEFFRRELLAALEILERGDISARAMRGSWAGAMGQVQFMPSTFHRAAVDFDGDGKRDIWSDVGDALASGANYLAQDGWVRGQTWGREVLVPPGFDREMIGLQIRRGLAAWQAMGVRRIDGSDLPAAGMHASLVQPTGPEGRAFLVYENFRVILKWNRSVYFGTAVGGLADAISESGGD